MYRIVLDANKVFRHLYVANGISLICNNVWFEGDVWDPSVVFGPAAAAKEEEICGVVENCNCVFSVIQSTSGASPTLIADHIKQFL